MNTGVLVILIIIGMMFALSLKSRTPELSSMLSLAICIVIISICVSRLKSIISVVDRLNSYIDIDSGYLIILLKLVGIAYVCEFAAGISREAGYGAIASQIELLGKLTMMVVSLPVLLAVIEMVVGMLGGV
jgi:stage III sporulation protein AD